MKKFDESAAHSKRVMMDDSKQWFVNLFLYSGDERHVILFAKDDLDIKISVAMNSWASFETTFMKRKPKSSKPAATPEFSRELPAEVLEAFEEVESMADSDMGSDRSGKKVTKSAAARSAIDQGYVTPARAIPFIKSQFGISIGPQHFSAVKSQYKQKQETLLSDPNWKKNLTTSTKFTTQGELGLMEALEGVKELVGQFGAEKVKRMVDLLG